METTTYKFHFNSTIGFVTMEQRFEILKPSPTVLTALHEAGIKFNEKGHWVWYLWVGSMSEGKNARFSYDESLKRLKELCREREYSKQFLYLTGSSVSKSYENPLQIDLS